MSVATSTEGSSQKKRKLDESTAPSSATDEYVSEVVRHHNLQLETDSSDVLRNLPEPAVFAKRLIEQQSSVDEAHDYAIADSALTDTIGTSWSIGKVREELGGVSHQAVHQRVGRGTLLGLPTSEGVTVYPTFQFIRQHGKLRVKPGLQRMFKVLKGQDPWQVAVLLNAPASELDDQSPIEWEKTGGPVQELERLAETFVRGWERL